MCAMCQMSGLANRFLQVKADEYALSKRHNEQLMQLQQQAQARRAQLEQQARILRRINLSLSLSLTYLFGFQGCPLSCEATSLVLEFQQRNWDSRLSTYPTTEHLGKCEESFRRSSSCSRKKSIGSIKKNSRGLERELLSRTCIIHVTALYNITSCLE